MKNVLVLEGQFGQCIQNQLITPMLKKHEFNVVYDRWNFLVIPIKKYDIVIGHSLGGHSALTYVSKNPNSVAITIDPRWQSNAGYVDLFPLPRLFPDFKAPKGAVIHNFYQNGFFHGYPVYGAASEQKLSWTSHLTICGRKEVADCFEKLLLE